MDQLLETVLFMVNHLEKGNLRSATKFLMINLYMPTEKAGYHTLVIAIPTYCDDREQSMTKELYPKVGRQIGSSGKKVEKDIRGVIKKGWNRRNKEVWRPFFPQCRQPSNREFIARIADVLELWQILAEAEKDREQ